jgi:hypothetical protein
MSTVKKVFTTKRDTKDQDMHEKLRRATKAETGFRRKGKHYRLCQAETSEANRSNGGKQCRLRQAMQVEARIADLGNF